MLEEVEKEGVDLIVIGGDVAWGPFPRATVERLQQLEGAAFIRGNADREVAARLDASSGLDEMTAAINLWCADQLLGPQRRWLQELPVDLSLAIDGLDGVLFCHGSPRSDEESLTLFTTDERLRAALADVAEGTVVCGHTHIQFRRQSDGKRVVNAGSVGLPYEGAPGAYWALLGPEVELRKTRYDTAAAVNAMRRTDCPHVEEVFIETILRPPSAEEAARQFEAG